MRCLRFVLILFTCILITSSGNCNDTLLEVGKKYVTTGDNESVWSKTQRALWAYCFYSEDGHLESSEISALKDSYGVFTSIKSGFIVTVTTVEENVMVSPDPGSSGKTYGPFTVYTIYLEGKGQYYKTFGRGLKPFG